MSDGSNNQTISVTATTPLKEDYTSATIESCDYRVEAKIISCKRSGAWVVFTYQLTNNGLGDINDWRIYPPESISLISGAFRSVITDNLGNSYTRPTMTFGNKSTAGTNTLNSAFYKGVPYKGEIILSNVPSSATQITVMLGVWAYTHTPNITSKKIYFRNVPIY